MLWVHVFGPILVFCATWVLASSLVSAQQSTLTSTKPPEPDDEAVMAMCKTELRLSGAVYNPAKPERSFALFELSSNHHSAVYRVGSRVRRFELVTVAPRGVVLKDHEGECWLQLVGEPISGRRNVARAAARPKPAKASKRARKGGNSKTSAIAIIGKSSH